MDIGINVSNDTKICIGETLEDVKAQLESVGLNYQISYKKQRLEEGNTDIIMFIEKCGLEIHIYRDIIIYIKSNNNTNNFLLKIDNVGTPAIILKDITNKIAERFGIDPSLINIERFDGKTLGTTVSVPISDTVKLKMTLVCDINNYVYLKAIQLV